MPFFSIVQVVTLNAANKAILQNIYKRVNILSTEINRLFLMKNHDQFLRAKIVRPNIKNEPGYGVI